MTDHLNMDEGDIGLSSSMSTSYSVPSLSDLARPASVSATPNGRRRDVSNPVDTKGESSRADPRPRLVTSLSRSRSLNLRIPIPDQSSQPASAHPSTRPRPSFTPLSPTRSTLRPSTRQGPLINEEIAQRMSRWIKEIVVCNFDLERGPVVERRVGSRRWGPGEKENV